MPFTISHAAAAIPFRRTPLIISAVVMGCFVPDFPYLLSLSPHMAIGHTFAGMFVFDLPLAFAALWLFHTFLKRPMLMFLPSGIRSRLTTSVTSFPFRPSKRFWLIVLSILIGSATHLLWDTFTHSNSWIYKHWAFLRGRVTLPVAGGMQMYLLLEYASSIFGLAVVAIWIWLWYRSARPDALPVPRYVDLPQRRAFVAVLPTVAMLGGALRAYYRDGLHLHIRPIVHFAADTLITAIAIFLLGLFVCGLILRRHRPMSVRV